MLTESKWEKENNSTTLLKMLYILTFQTTIVPLPSNYNCCPSPLPIMTIIIVLLLLLSPSIIVLLLSLSPLPNYNCSPSPPCLGTSFVSKHCMHDFTVWANHIHRLNSWYWKIEVITFASTCCFSFLSFLSSEICQLFVLEFKKFGDLHFCQM